VTGPAGTAFATPAERRVSPLRVLDLVGIAAGLVGTHRAQSDMGRSWRIGVAPKVRTALITDGLFRYVRNPLFTFMTLVGTASTIAVPNTGTAASAAMLAAVVYIEARLVEEP